MLMAKADAALNVMQGSSALDPDMFLDRIMAMNSKSTMVQAFDGSMVINRLHLQAAYANAAETFSEGMNISDKLYIEFLLFAAMTRQIGAAASLFRIKDMGNFIIASDNAFGIDKVKRFARLSEFKPSREHELETAKAFGVESDYGHLNQRILQKMAVSRLQD